jgi:hypothetical protein
MRIRRTFCAVAGSLMAAVATSCGLVSDIPQSDNFGSGYSSGGVGSVYLDFAVPSTLSISSFDYAVQGNGFGPVEGTVDVSAPGASASAYVGGIPPGSGYQLSLNATTADRGTFCQGISVFDIVAKAATTLDLTMVCVNNETMRITYVDGTAHSCPAIGSYTVATVDGAIALSASAYAFDGNSSLTFLWQAPAGTLASPTDAVSSYDCDGVTGQQQLTLTVSDGSCDDAVFVDVTCPSSL